MKNLITSQAMLEQLVYIYIKYIYSEEEALNQKPYIITENDNVWTVLGQPPAALGGRFKIIISKDTGEVLYLKHSC